MPAPPPILRIQGVTAGYHRRTPVLHDVGLSLFAGEILALVGPNGSGKSSLLKLSLGRLRAGAGEVRWFDRALPDWPRRALARRVAYLPQAPTALVGERVADVLASGRSPYWGAFGVESQRDRQAVAQAAELLGLTGWLGRDLDTLSGGQRQRVFIGRCVAQVLGDDSPVEDGAAILLDEPDTFLDLKHAAELSATLRALARERRLGILFASHDLNLAAGVADRLALLSEGRLVATGLPAEVLTAARVEQVYATGVEILSRARRPVVVPLQG